MPTGRTVISMLLDGRSGPSCMVRTARGCRIHHCRFPDDVTGEDPGLPAGWSDRETERILSLSSERSRLLRMAAEAEKAPLNGRWAVDPTRFTRS